MEKHPLPTAPYPPVRSVLPHREPFLFLDEVVELGERRVVGVKRFSADEPFFQGHFPGQPVVPGVLLVEALGQAMAYHTLVARPGLKPLLLGIEQARFRTSVAPGATVRLEVELGEERFGMQLGTGLVRVDGKVVAEATLKGFTGQPGALGP